MQRVILILLPLFLIACAHDPVELRAVQGDAAAQYEIGMRYRNDREEDQALAASWLAKAAAQNHADAQNNLGRMYELGEGGLPRDFDKAIELYRKAAAGGCMSAHYNLGAMYRSGRGVSQDHRKAIEWFRRAGRFGDTDAWLALSEIYFNGEGVPVNFKEAYIWAVLAATTRSEVATRHRDRVAVMLTPEELGTAQAAATAFQEKLNAQAQ